MLPSSGWKAPHWKFAVVPDSTLRQGVSVVGHTVFSTRLNSAKRGPIGQHDNFTNRFVLRLGHRNTCWSGYAKERLPSHVWGDGEIFS